MAAPAGVSWVLETLDTVPWHDLTHAYGSAADVPGLIRKLASRRRPRREAALRELYGNIWHQGTVYEATAYAVPFLMELVQDRSVHERELILELLAILANGHSYIEVHSHLDPPRDDPAYAAELASEREWVRQARAAVLDGFHVYLRLLDDPDPAVRTGAAYALGGLHERAAESHAALHLRLDQEPAARAKAQMLQTLGKLAKSEPETLHRLQVALGVCEHPFVRLAAATMLTEVLGEETPSEAVDILIAVVLDPRPLKPYCQDSMWAAFGAVPTASSALCHLGATVHRVVLPRLIAALESRSGNAAYWVAGALFRLVFDGRLGDNAPASALSEDQRLVLSAIARSDGVWMIETKMTLLLRGINLPEGRDLLLRFLAQSAR
jgi:HEAT repeat